MDISIGENGTAAAKFEHIRQICKLYGHTMQVTPQCTFELSSQILAYCRS